MKDHIAILSNVPVSSYFTYFTRAKPPPAAVLVAANYPGKLRSLAPEVEVVTVVGFVCVLDFENLLVISIGFVMLSIATSVKAGGYRDA